MVLPRGDRTGSQTSRASHAQPPHHYIGSTSGIDRDKAFQLIDRVLPFEACLYYQILPLSLEGSRLRLGMVNLADSTALDYVRRILAYLHCSLVPQTIQSDVHYTTLSAYLNYSGKAQQATTVAAKDASMAETQIGAADLTKVASLVPMPQPVEPIGQFLVHYATPEIEKPQSAHPAVMAPDQRDTLLLDRSDDSLPSVVEKDTEATDTSSTMVQSFETLPPSYRPPPGSALPVLDLTIDHLESPLAQLVTLPPDQLLQELLARVLEAGIGRLYFERHAQGGRILWSKDGVLMSVLENLSATVLQTLINELKILTHVDIAPVQASHQVEVERLYKKDRLLLRLRLMVNDYGEEATFQVLRGPALKFYQQQQLLHLSRNALGVARNLYQKVSELRERTHEPVPSEQMVVITEIDRVMHQVNQHLTDLQDHPVVPGIEEFRVVHRETTEG